VCDYRVATILETLEYSGISLNMENSGNSQGILCNIRENCNKVFLVCHSFDWVNRIIRNNRDEVTCYIAGVGVE